MKLMKEIINANFAKMVLESIDLPISITQEVIDESVRVLQMYSGENSNVSEDVRITIKILIDKMPYDLIGKQMNKTSLDVYRAFGRVKDICSFARVACEIKAGESFYAVCEKCIKTLDLSTRSFNALMRAGVYNIGCLLVNIKAYGCGKWGAKYRCVGDKTMEEIETALYSTYPHLQSINESPEDKTQKVIAALIRRANNIDCLEEMHAFLSDAMSVVLPSTSLDVNIELERKAVVGLLKHYAFALSSTTSEENKQALEVFGNL